MDPGIFLRVIARSRPEANPAAASRAATCPQEDQVNQSLTNLISGAEVVNTEQAPLPVATQGPEGRRSPAWRETLRSRALTSAIRKRALGVPSYSVPEAAALLSLSQEYLYRLIQSDAFPAARMRSGDGQGRYVVPAKAVEGLLDWAAKTGSCVESADFTRQWNEGRRGGET
jgi:excisionase family DNA binding protein